MLATIRSWLARAPRHPFKLARYVVRSKTEHDPTPAESSPTRARRRAGADRPTILVVDDNRDLADAICLALSLDDYRFHVAYDGRRGLEICQSVWIDLVLVDRLMPRMNGLELAAALQADSRTADIPVILLAIDTRSANCERTQVRGITDILEKPIDFGQMMEMIPSRLRRRH